MEPRQSYNLLENLSSLNSELSNQCPVCGSDRVRLQQVVAALLGSSALTNWERSFLQSIQGKRSAFMAGAKLSLSPKQNEKLNAIFVEKGGR